MSFEVIYKLVPCVPGSNPMAQIPLFRKDEDIHGHSMKNKSFEMMPREGIEKVAMNKFRRKALVSS